MTRQLMDWLTHSLKSLNVPGPESLKLLGQSKDFEDAQIALSALLERGDKAVIVSNDKHFDAMGKLTVLTPAACLDKLEEVDNKQ